MVAIDPEDVDLAQTCERLRRTFDGGEIEGYSDGRTAIRDALMAQMRCSALEAEDLVETMIGRGYLRFEGDPSHAAEDGRWFFARGD